MAGGAGDPILTKFDNQSFPFDGVHGKRYNLATIGDFRILGRIAELGAPGTGNPTFFVGIDVLCPSGATVKAGRDGGIDIDAGEYGVHLERKFCTYPAIGHPALPPEASEPISLSLPGKCEVYAGLRSGVNVFHAGVRSEITHVGCSLDAPGHLGKTTDVPHPLMGVAHINFRLTKFPAERPNETGLLVDGDRVNARPEDYEVVG